MSDLEGKELSYATMTGPGHAVSVGSFGPILSSTSVGSKVVKMTICEPWVLVDLKAEMGRTVRAAIPITSFLTTVLK